MKNKGLFFSVILALSLLQAITMQDKGKVPGLKKISMLIFWGKTQMFPSLIIL